MHKEKPGLKRIWAYKITIIIVEFYTAEPILLCFNAYFILCKSHKICASNCKCFELLSNLREIFYDKLRVNF